MNSTALGAENKKKQTINFISEAHEKFYYEKLKEVRYQDCLLYTSLQQAGLVCEGMYDDYTDAGVKADSERITFVTRKE